MFENPKDDLQELEKHLHNLDNKDEDFEDFYAKIFDEFGDKTPSEEDTIKELLAEHPPRKVQPSGKGKVTYADNKQKQAESVKKDKSIPALTVLIVVELLGIVGVAAWWILHLL